MYSMFLMNIIFQPESSDEEGWINEDNLADALKKMGAFEVKYIFKIHMSLV